MGFPMKAHTTTYIVLPKGSNTTLVKPLDPAANLQDIRRREDHAKLHQSNAISKIQATGHTTGQMLQV